MSACLELLWLYVVGNLAYKNHSWDNELTNAVVQFVYNLTAKEYYIFEHFASNANKDLEGIFISPEQKPIFLGCRHMSFTLDYEFRQPCDFFYTRPN